MAKSSRSKILPAQQQSSGRIKDVVIPLEDNSNELRPFFSFEYLDSKFCVSKCDKLEKASFADTIRMIGQMTWNDLISSGRHQNGFETIHIDQIKGKIPPIITEDVNKVIAFRFHKKKPVVGHRIGRVFYIIWLDRNFKLYKH